MRRPSRSSDINKDCDDPGHHVPAPRVALRARSPSCEREPRTRPLEQATSTGGAGRETVQLLAGVLGDSTAARSRQRLGWPRSRVTLVRIAGEGLDLHVAEDGDSSAPPVLLLHGIIGSRATWEWLVPELTGRFRVLRLDFRGHGQSDRAAGRYTAAGYVADAVAALEQAAGRPCVVVGHSLGGATAAVIAQRRPELLTGVVLEDPPLGSTTVSEPVSLEGNALLEGFRFLREAIPQVQQAEMTVDALVEVIAATPHTSGSGTFGDVLLADGVASMAASMLEVDAAVLDPVLAGQQATSSILLWASGCDVADRRRSGQARRRRQPEDGRALRLDLARRRGRGD